MKSLLLVAHGSRKASSNDEVRQLTENLAGKATGHFDDVRCAFLELAEPSIPDGLQQCADAGADEIVVFPYFLSAGRHVVEDIPGEIDKKKDELSSVTIRQADYLGSLDGIVDMMLNAVT